MHTPLLTAAYGVLLTSGVLHFAGDVAASFLRRTRTPGPETTLYYGLHTAISLGEVLIAITAFLIMRSGSPLMGQPVGLLFGILAVTAWLVICFAFAEHWPPRVWLMVVLGLLLGAAATA